MQHKGRLIMLGGTLTALTHTLRDHAVTTSGALVRRLHGTLTTGDFMRRKGKLIMVGGTLVAVTLLNRTINLM